MFMTGVPLVGLTFAAINDEANRANSRTVFR